MYNTITNPTAVANSTCDKTGIYISNPAQDYTKTVIEGNYSNNTQFGIYINKVSSQFAATGGVNPAIVSNEVLVSLPAGSSGCGFINYYSYGIWICMPHRCNCTPAICSATILSDVTTA